MEIIFDKDAKSLFNGERKVFSTSGAGKTKSNGPKTNEFPHTEKNEVVTLPNII